MVTSASNFGGIERPFTRFPGQALNLGPTGARLWATYVNKTPGMAGSFEFIHKANVPRLFEPEFIADGKRINFKYVSSKWFQSHLTMAFEADGIILNEEKFITWNDCAIDILTITNHTSEKHEIILNLSYGIDRHGEATGAEWSFEHHGITAHIRSDVKGKSGSIVLQPKEKVRWIIASAAGTDSDDAGKVLRSWLDIDNPLKKHKDEYDCFFTGAPEFTCSDPAFEMMWKYRWYLLRRNLANPATGNILYPLYYEGRSVMMTTDAWKPKGWEFSKLIPFATVMHILEGRWHRDLSACKGEILNLVANQNENGLLPCVYINSLGSDYTDLTAWAAWQLYLVDPDKDWLSQVAYPLMKQVAGTINVYDRDADFLPVVLNHGATGKEYQPSFFYKSGYPDRAPKEMATPLERVDAACYLYMNASAVHNIMSELGYSKESEQMEQTANNIKKAILDKMWDNERGFFYDIDETLHDKIPVENVVGSDPFLAEIAGAEHLRLFERFSDPKQFLSDWPLTSTTMQCPAYEPDARWKGEHIKGKFGCIWNGPTWPFTNSTCLMAIANASLISNHSLDSLFAKLLKSFTMMCFRDGNPNDPIIYEHYNPETGQPISQEEDYFHSSWIDIIIRYVAGINPMPHGKVEFHPINCGFQHFSLRNVYIGSHKVNVNYDAESGYTAEIDGKAVDIPAFRPSQNL